MPSLMIIKRFEFEAAHLLPDHPGKCANLHGHRYELEIGIGFKNLRMNDLNDQGMIADFSDLKALVKSEIIDHLDHQNLNKAEPRGFPRINPTAENMVVWIVSVLEGKVRMQPIVADLMLVRLWETSSSYVEWRA